MYKPPERIKHPLPMATGPTRAEAGEAMLFSPLSLPSGLELATRTWVPAMVPWRATEDGFVTDDVIDWYARFADGRPGVIVVEATGIRDVPSGPLLRIGHDRNIPGLTRLVDTVRQRSGGHTRVLIQIIDFLRIRRRPQRERYLREFLVIRDAHREAVGSEHEGDEAVREALIALDDTAIERILDARELEALRFGARERVWDEHVPHIRALPETLPPLFAAAAVRAQRAGFDGVELHYAHAYTMASFLSALNRRTDGYGGDRRGRIRLPVEVLRAVRAAVGNAFTVGCRMLCDEIIDGGSRVDDAAFFATRLAAEGIDFLSLSTGGKFEDAKQPKVGRAAYPYTGKSGWECMPTAIADALGPFGRNVPKQSRIRRAVRDAGFETPVVICGGISHFAQAERYLRRGDGDIIAAARQSLADPDWFLKTRLGRADAVRRCIYSNYCEALDQKHEKVTCQLWDRDEAGTRRLLPPPWEERSVHLE